MSHIICILVKYQYKSITDHDGHMIPYLPVNYCNVLFFIFIVLLMLMKWEVELEHATAQSVSFESHSLCVSSGGNGV